MGKGGELERGFQRTSLTKAKASFWKAQELIQNLREYVAQISTF